MVLEKEMNLTTDYEDLVNEFLAEVDLVQAPLEDYIGALEHVREEVEQRIATAREDLARRKGRK